MAMSPHNHNPSEADRQDEYMRGGKGRKDEVGKSGIYPADAPDAPADAVVRSPGELAGHKGPRTQKDDATPQKDDQSTGSE